MSKSRKTNWRSDSLEGFKGIEKLNMKVFGKDLRKMSLFKLAKKDR